MGVYHYPENSQREQYTTEAIQDWLIQHLARHLAISPEEIEIQEPFASYGLSSRDAVTLSGDLEDWSGRQLSPTLVWEYPTISALAHYLATESDSELHENNSTLEVSSQSTEAIAIIGIGCRFPGADGPEEFWQMLHQGRDAIGKVPEERRDHWRSAEEQPLTEAITSGGFLPHVEQFDAEFFNIAPREAVWMDPQQRLLLEVAWEALEHAGQAADKLAGSQTGIFIGISSNDYTHIPMEQESINAYLGTGNAFSIAANRLSYFLDVRGPSMAIDTACSSSLVAVHLACQSLRAGESNLALVGGVNLLLTPELSIAFSQAQMLASDGRCKTFDVQADGYGRSEGCGVIVLKRKTDAERDGDRILAVIRGSAVNQDGRSNGLTAPNHKAQEAVIRQALKNAALEPGQISYIEAHGTGTPLGDPIEIQALGAVFRTSHTAEHPCFLGSVKTNIGHLEAAAGIAGLIKTVLSLMHGEIPPHLHLQTLNPHISQENLPFHIVTAPRTWTRGREPRRAGVSSFGFGGTNAHLILEEGLCDSATAQESDAQRPLHLLTLSARSEIALKQLVSRYEYHIAHHPEQQLQDICYTANTGRNHFPHRLAILARSSKSVQEQLQMFSIREKANGLWYGKGQNRRKPKIAFLFTGQGSHYPGMGKQLYETQPGFRKSLDLCDEIIRPSLKQPLQAAIIAAPETPDLFADMAYVQVVLFALEYALTELWSSWGITPDIVLGHSVGEYAAACAAGAFSLEEGLQLVYERGRLMNNLPEKGAMAAVLTDANRVLEQLADCAGEIVISAFNGPRHTVIAGPTEMLANALQKLEAQGIATQPLPIGLACHSAFVDPICEAFEQLASQVSYRPLKRALVSTVTGQLCEPGEKLDASYWRRQLREPVHFAQAIAILAAYGVHCNLEIGPAPSLLGMGKRCFAPDSMIWLPSLKQKQHDWHVLLSSLGELYVQGATVNWQGFESGYARNRIELPTYPFERKRYWLKSASVEQKKGRGTEQTIQGAQSSHTHHGKLQCMSEHPSATYSTQQVSIAQTEMNGVQPRQATTILATLRNLVGGLLQVDAESIDDQAPFLEMGADSLVLLEAVRTIERSFGIKLAVRQLFEELTTLQALADYIAHHMPAAYYAEDANSQQQHQSEIAIPLQEMEQWALPEINQHAAHHQIQNGHTEQPAPDKMASTGAERLMGQQLSLLSQIMSQQLAIIQHSTTTAQDKWQSTNSPGEQARHRTQEQDLPAQPISQKNGARPEQKPYVPYQAIRPGTIGGLTQQQQQHLDSLIERYTRRTQQSRKQTEAWRSVLADNRNAAGFRFSIKEMLYPIIAQRSQGANFWDVDGNEYIDISMGFGVNLLGHNAPFIAEAIEAQLKQGMQLGPQAELAGEVAELIHELTGMARVAFCNSGTEAVMTALRLARTGTGRKKIVIFAGSYHGTFDGVLAEEHHPSKDSTASPIAPGTPAGMIADVLVLDYASEHALELIETHAHELAAVLVEPVQSRRPELQPKAFLQQIRHICDQRGIALIFDEVITGFRIHPGGAQAWFGVNADLATYGKIVGGGMPIGVVAGKASFMDGIDGGIWHYGDMSYPQAETTFFAGTFCKHPLTMAAARAVLNVLKSTGAELQEGLNKKTVYLVRTLNRYFIEEQVPLRVVHFGSLFRFTFTGNMDLFFYHLLDKGIYIWEGRNCFLSTAHTDEHIATIIQAVKESITEMRAGGFLPAGPASPGNTSIVEEQRELTPAKPAIRTQKQHNMPEKVPLTEAQKQLWLLAHVEDNASLAYNETIAVLLEGELQQTELHRAIQMVIDRHEALRTTIDNEGEWQYIQSGLTIDLPVFDFSHTVSNEARTHIEQWLKAESQCPFDLLKGPLVRFSLLSLGEQRHIFVLSAHHIMVDGWSMGIILQEISAYYSAACNHITCDPVQPLQFREYVHWQKQQQQGPEFSEDEALWLEQFRGPLPVLELPADHPRPVNQSFHGARLSFTLDEQLCNALKQVSRQHGCTLFMTLLACYTALLHRITGQDDIIVGVPVAGRGLEGSENLVGYCANIVPLRSTIRVEETFLEHLAEIKKSWLSSYGRHEYPFSLLINKLRLPRDPSRFPLLSSTFNLDRATSTPHMHNLTARIMLPDIYATKFDLSLNSIEQSGELLLQFDYNPDLFDEGTIRRLQGYLQMLLENIVVTIEQPLKKMQILRPEEIQQQFIEWNATWRLYPLDRGVHQLFEIQVRKNPAAVAIEQQGRQITYQELNIRANQVAHYLQEQLHIQPEQCIGIMCERSIEQVIAVLGILKAGGTYLPVDPKYPRERAKFMLQDAQVPLVLSQMHLREQIEESGVEVLYLDDEEEQKKLAARDETNPVSKVAMEQRAYVIYTSGSTGLPKGVEVTHNNLLNLVYWHLQNFTMSSEDSATLIASPSFDASVWELWPCLIAGVRLKIPDEETRISAPDLRDWLIEQKVNFCYLPTPLAEAIIALPWPEQVPLRMLSAGGDVLHQLPAPLPFKFYNIYGPTEYTVVTTTFEVQYGEGRLPAIGQPIANTQLYVLDTQQQPVPIGVAGELYIGGDGLARGYLQRPELTAERFVPHPYSLEPGARLYRTGDLVRYRTDGTLEFLRRIDQQVKLRGFRIELNEIIVVFRQHTYVQDATVVLREGQAGERRLIAYVVATTENDQNTIQQALRKHLKTYLPEYMLPGEIVFLQAIPLTPNGKVDRRALPEPERQSNRSAQLLPGTPTEQQLATIWQALLEQPAIGLENNFFELGGHSLLLTRLANQIQSTFHLEMPLRTLFHVPMLAEMARAIDDGRREQSALSHDEPIARIERTERLPLSFAQRRLWFLQRFEQQSAAYNIPLVVRLTGRLEPDILEQTLQHIVQRHEILHTTFEEVEGVPYLRIVAPECFHYMVVDLKAIPSAFLEDEVHISISQEAQHPFSLEKDVPIRACLLQIGSQEHILILTLHHIATDGWSTSILVQEIASIYRALLEGVEPHLPALAIQYADFAYWQQRWLQGERRESLLAYWQKQLEGAAPFLHLPTDRARPAIQTFNGAHLSFALTQELSAALNNVARQQQVTLFMLLLAAFEVLLHHYSHQEEILIGTPIANRTRPEIEQLIGMFVNTLVLRAHLHASMSFKDLLNQVRDTSLEAYTHQDLPFEMLVEHLAPERNLSYHPLFQVFFALQNAPQPTIALPKLALQPMDIEHGVAKFDLTLTVEESKEGLRGDFEYNTDLFEAATITRMIGHFQTILESIIVQVESPLWQLCLLTATERQQLLVTWNETQADYPAEQSIQQLIEAQVARTPEAPAISFGGETLTYRELNEKANRVAYMLQSLGVGPDVLVGLCVERSLAMSIGLLAILKAGGAYLPLDPALPAERITFMLQDAQAPILLTQSHLQQHFQAPRTCVLYLDEQERALTSSIHGNPAPNVLPEHLAYVIYTSGSTGRPKGVQISQQATLNLLTAMQQEIGISTQDRLLAITTLSFDIATMEMLLPLISGAQLIIAPRESVINGEALASLIETTKCTILQATPVSWRMLLAAGWRAPVGLKMLCGGEALPADLAAQLLISGDTLYNLYGPTETTIWSTYARIEEGAEITIGKPIANTTIYLLDAQQQPVPIGVPGELYIGGDGLSRGYLHRPDLTAERFVPNPFARNPGERLYRTGDLARYQAHGQLCCLGRIDFQVKLRGFRIEPGEIENILRQHPAIREGVVVLREDAPGDQQLVAYLVPIGEEATDLSQTLRSYLREQLPDYMIPGEIMLLEELPKTPNNKIDRKALPNPIRVRKESVEDLPKTVLEEELATLWENLLSTKQIRLDDNFFELGGHSLLLTQLATRIRAAFKVEISLQTLFQEATLTRMAEAIKRALHEQQALSVQPLVRATREQKLPLSFAQQRLWFLQQLDEQSPAYNMPSPVRLKGALNISTLEQALQEIIRRHESLRTTFGMQQGHLVQIVQPETPFTLNVLEAGDITEDQLREFILQEAQQPFQLAQELPIRASLFKINTQEHVLLLTLHHIASDGWSTGLLMQELTTLYLAFAQGRPSPLAELPIQYADFAIWQRQWLQGTFLETLLAYWKKQLEGAPALLNLPTDHPRPTIQAYRGARRRFTLSSELTTSIKALAYQEQVTLFMVLLAGLQTLLHHYSQQDDILVGTPIANRTRQETEQLIGVFVNTLVLRGRIDPRNTFRALLHQVRTTTLEAYKYQDLPFETLVNTLAPERNLSHHPLFQVMLVLQNTPGATFASPTDKRHGLELQEIELDSGIARFDLTFALEESNEGLRGELEYNTDLFEEQSITRLIAHFQSLLEQIVAGPEQKLWQLSPLSKAEKIQILETWNQTEQTLPEEISLSHLFESQAERNPAAVAVVFEHQQLNYQELNQRANQLAHLLKERGIRPEQCVGLAVEPSLEMLIGFLAILKAGGVYVPLDPGYPKERLLFMLADAQIALLLTQQHLIHQIPETDLPTLCLDNLAQKIALYATQNLARETTGENLAYIIYTSGSTGRPKGAMVTHRGLYNLAEAQGRAFGINAESKVLQFASINFDASISEFAMTFMSGATLYLAPRDVLAEPLTFLRQQAITAVTLPPTILAVLPEHDLPALQTVVSAGEACTAELVERWAAGRCFFNAYGPTEITVCSTIAACSPDGKQPAIGRPIANNQVYVLDRFIQSVPIGAVGELYLGGIGLARGYLGQPALSAEHFVPDPFSKEAGARLYKTGDLGRYAADGSLYCLGRSDQQIKFHGFRIELGEIEAHLSQLPEVQQAIACVREDQPGIQHLIAYVVPAEGKTLTSNELKHYLQSRIPHYMIPALIILLDALPYLPNGKVDRKALPAPASERPEMECQEASNDIEKILAEICANVLGVEQIGIHDNFFEMGGDSILSIQVIVKAREAGLQLNPKQFFQYQTIAQLAAVASIAPAVQAEQGCVTGEAPLTPIQHWFFELNNPERQHWNQAILLTVKQPLEHTFLRQACQALLQQHDSLRARYKQEETGWRQVFVEEEEDEVFHSVDLSGLAGAEQLQALERVAGEAQASLNLADGPLFCAVYFDLGKQQDRLLLIVHHLVIDIISWYALLEDLQTAYLCLQQGVAVDLPAKTSSYKEWATRLAAYAQTEQLQQEIAFWLDPRRESIKPLPREHEDGRNIEGIARNISIKLESSETSALQHDVSASYHTSIHEVLLTALALSVAQWNDTQRILIDLEGFGREELFETIDTSRTAGWFTAIYPVVLEVPETFYREPGEALKSIKEQLRQVPQHGIGYGLLRYLSENQEHKAQLQARARAEIIFNYQGHFDQRLPQTGLFGLATEPIGPAHSALAERGHQLEINAYIVNRQLHVDWTYSEEQYAHSTIEQLAHAFTMRLRALIAHCQSSEAGGYTPSDFSKMSFEQGELDELLDELSFSIED